MYHLKLPLTAQTAVGGKSEGFPPVEQFMMYLSPEQHTYSTDADESPNITFLQEKLTGRAIHDASPEPSSNSTNGGHNVFARRVDQQVRRDASQNQ